MSNFIAKDADIYGDVSIGENCSIYFHSVLRSEDSSITIEDGSNIQDGCILHAGEGHPIIVGKNVTVGHRVLLHGCTIKENCIIGMGSIIMNGAIVEENCLIGANSLITEGKVIPAGSLAYGNPCRVIRSLTLEEQKQLSLGAIQYQKWIERYQGK